ncbi:MAG: hypothetical protein VSS75_017250 [Candidatus Parabeggiatoa sp.]|nr:hypothetical protein [Candidatus Parabeggiatoa sp.]
MNPEIERLKKIVYECEKHIQRIDSAALKMGSFMPLNQSRYDRLDEDEVEHIDQFLFRFLKLQDAIGQKLFKTILRVLKEDIENKPFIDILNRLDKLELIPDIEAWMALINIRNSLAHEYENDSEEISRIINNIYDRRELLKSFFYQIHHFIVDKQIINHGSRAT